MYTVYILLSQKDNRTYIGYTDNLERRLHEHNSGKVTATKHRTPLEIFYTEKFETIAEAKKKRIMVEKQQWQKKIKTTI